MQAWLCERLDGPEALRWAELPDPEPGPGEVRVRVAAASLNFPDLLITQGKYQARPALPFVPGAEFAGVVDAVGAQVRGWQPGQRVIAIGGTGGLGTQAVVPAERLLPLPAGFPMHEAAAFVFTYGTSHHALIDRGALKAGETVLILGAASGVGTAALQIARQAGARVIAVASTPHKRQACLDLGAQAAIAADPQELRAQVTTLTEGRGVDVVYDAVGGALAEPALRSLAWRGRYLVVGFASGQIPALPFNLALLKGASIVGVFWGDFMRREPQAATQALAALFEGHAQGALRPHLDQVLPLARLPEAFTRMASRQVVGKLVLEIDPALC
ncbi:NADPH:quinone oxidoreductase family protein [Ideonella livida]|uniref:NADPH:quinone oxidoreductase family protein n=1 Tax=Ideonella livida TaxID=2707176 RepID=A0A7C9TI19_9BURK|nr:NADPH:quinone oxidoreductase family protein [Ideonella livida]NDY90042.1 NADPH:quinone oxidoreductase family protein [Ideonella livida]